MGRRERGESEREEGRGFGVGLNWPEGRSGENQRS